MVEHTAGAGEFVLADTLTADMEVAADTEPVDIEAAVDTLPADMEAAVDTLPADMETAVDTLPATDREYSDTVTALYFVHYTDYIDRTVGIPSVRWPLVECHSHHRNAHWDHFVYHNLYRKLSLPRSAEPLRHAYHVHILYKT
jgi:hypothetical protein